LPDGRIAALNTRADVKSQIQELENLTDMQQLLLAGAYVRQGDGVGSSHNQGVAELGHATIVSVSTNPATIHKATHDFADSKQFASKVSSHTTIVGERGLTRPTDTAIWLPSSVVSLTFLPHHQAPLPQTNFEVSAGFALAARTTQGNSGFSLSSNAAAMAEQMGHNA